MNPRTLVLFVVAAVIAVGAFLLARSYLTVQQARVVAAAPQPAPKPTRAILVAKADIGRGQILKPDDMTWQVWPENAITPAYIVQGGAETAQSFAGWVAVDPIAGGAPVTKTTIISPGSGGFLAAVLKPGMRALQVPTPGQLPSGTEPGDRVDMIVYFPVDWNKPQNAVETVMHDVRILAVGGQMQAGKPTQPQVPGAAPASATFEVTPQQAEVIALAQRMGTITFTLDSLRQPPRETSERGSPVRLASDVKTADPPGNETANSAKKKGEASAELSDENGATYLTDNDVNHLLRSPSHEVKVEVTVLRGAAKPDAVPVTLRCDDDGCVVEDDMPERLVGAQ